MKSARLTKHNRPLASVAAGILAGLVLAGCDGRRETREILWTPDMHFSESIKAQEPNPWAPTGSMFMPVEGTVPVNFQPYTITDAEADELANELVNPLPATQEVLTVGARYYGIYCQVCHGENGDGLGSVILRQAGMPRPPSLYSEKLIDEWKDGRIYHVITVGQGNMPGYAAKMDPDKRWAVIHYVRSLQQAQTAGEQEQQEAEEFLQQNPQVRQRIEGG